MRLLSDRPNGLRSGRTGRRLRAAVLAAVATGLSAVPAGAADWKSRLSLRAGGGLGILSWGDVETLKNSYRQQVRDTAREFGIPTTGTCKNPWLGWQGEIELLIDVNGRFGLGLALGRHSRRGETVLSADWPPFLTSKHVWSQSSVVTPITLSAYWHFPMGARSRAYVKAGAGLASAVWKYKIRDEETIDFLSWEQIEGTARDRGLLVQAGLGCEIRVAKRLTAFVETRGQLLSLDGWRTDQVHSTDASSETISGRLWLAEAALPGGSPARTLLLASESWPDAWLYDKARAFRLNLSGVIFLAGLRLELGARPSSSTHE